jgi:hypothetical protein
MNTRILFHLAAIALLAVAAASAPVRSPSLPVAEVSPRIVDLPAITVRPAAEDAAYYRAHKIVDLAAVSVYPEAAERTWFVADAVRAGDCLC